VLEEVAMELADQFDMERARQDDHIVEAVVSEVRSMRYSASRTGGVPGVVDGRVITGFDGDSGNQGPGLWVNLVSSMTSRAFSASPQAVKPRASDAFRSL
jgi:hypothetical protein